MLFAYILKVRNVPIKERIKLKGVFWWSLIFIGTFLNNIKNANGNIKISKIWNKDALFFNINLNRVSLVTPGRMRSRKQSI